MSHHPAGQLERHGVQSTLLLAVAYDCVVRTLEVELVDGSVFLFMGVPERHLRDLLSAYSKGQYFRTHIQGQYQGRRIR